MNVAEKVHSTSHLAARRGGSRGEHFATQWPAARGNFTEKDAVVEGQALLDGPPGDLKTCTALDSAAQGSDPHE